MCEVIGVNEILEQKLDLVPASVIDNEKCNTLTNGKYFSVGN